MMKKLSLLALMLSSFSIAVIGNVFAESKKEDVANTKESDKDKKENEKKDSNKSESADEESVENGLKSK